jgi:hydrogenase-4 membrane subunit HyfE
MWRAVNLFKGLVVAGVFGFFAFGVASLQVNLDEGLAGRSLAAISLTLVLAGLIAIFHLKETE